MTFIVYIYIYIYIMLTFAKEKKRKSCFIVHSKENFKVFHFDIESEQPEDLVFKLQSFEVSHANLKFLYKRSMFKCIYLY